MADGLFDYFSRARGQERRAALGGLLSQFIPPELRPLFEAAGELNPITSMENAGQDAQQLFAPDQSIMDRIAAGGRMASNIASVVAPAAVATRTGVPLANAVGESLTGLSMSPQMMAARDFGADEFGGVGIPRLSSDPVAARGQEIMGMLTSGRAGEVTDQMLDLGDPVLNTRLNEYLYNNYDLPMDAASRAARAGGMGADLNAPLYRGDARSDLTSFDTGQFAREGIGVTSSTSPNVAATYMAGDSPAMYQIFSMANNPLALDATGRNWTGIPADAVTNRGILSDVLPPQSYLDEENLADFLSGNVIDWGDGSAAGMAMANTNDVSRAAQAAGFDEMRFQNVVDRGGAGRFHTGPANDPQTTVMTSNPADIRSRFARFDPRLSHLRNLNAALAAGVPLGLLFMQPEQEQY
jgi:hypothetical protein